MNDDELNQLTEKIIGSAFKVLNTLGVGFLEHVYEKALVHELNQLGILAEPQQSVEVFYDGIVVGEFFPDILVNKTVIIEVKATKNHDEAFTAQCLNYLKATGKPVCLLLNYGKPKLDIKRYRGQNPS